MEANTTYCVRCRQVHSIPFLSLLSLYPLSFYPFIPFIPLSLAPNQRLHTHRPAPEDRQRDRSIPARYRHVGAAPAALGLGLALGLVASVMEGIEAFLVADALGIEIALAAAVGIYAAAILAGALSFIPGGLGSAEAPR